MKEQSEQVKFFNAAQYKDEYESIGTHWIVLYVNDNNLTYFDTFGVEHIPKEIKKNIGNENITTNIYRIQACNSIICG